MHRVGHIATVAVVVGALVIPGIAIDSGLPPWSISTVHAQPADGPQVTAVPVTAKITGPTRMDILDTATFDATGSTGDDLRFVWRFGDGTFEMGGPTATHSFAAPGTYTVTVNVTDGITDAVASITVVVVDINSGS
jgi:hypothetical protein